MEYVAYYRVSTKRQEKSNLGLLAQEDSVKNYAKKTNGKILKSFTEIESGGKNDRATLKEAISLCKKTGATLLIAKLDRLSRSIKYIIE